MQFLVELGTSGWPGHPQPPAGSDELQDSGQAHPPLLILRIQGVKALVKVLIQGLGQGALHLCLGGLWEFQHAQEAGQHGALCRCGSSEMGRGEGGGEGEGRALTLTPHPNPESAVLVCMLGSEINLPARPGAHVCKSPRG